MDMHKTRNTKHTNVLFEPSKERSAKTLKGKKSVTWIINKLGCMIKGRNTTNTNNDKTNSQRIQKKNQQLRKEIKNNVKTFCDNYINWNDRKRKKYDPKAIRTTPTPSKFRCFLISALQIKTGDNRIILF